MREVAVITAHLESEGDVAAKRHDDSGESIDVVIVASDVDATVVTDAMTMTSTRER